MSEVGLWASTLTCVVFILDKAAIDQAQLKLNILALLVVRQPRILKKMAQVPNSKVPDKFVCCTLSAFWGRTCMAMAAAVVAAVVSQASRRRAKRPGVEVSSSLG